MQASFRTSLVLCYRVNVVAYFSVVDFCHGLLGYGLIQAASMSIKATTRHFDLVPVLVTLVGFILLTGLGLAAVGNWECSLFQ